MPVIAVTAHAVAEFKEKCNDAGMNDFIVKPVHFQELGAAIEKNTLDRQLTLSDSDFRITENEKRNVLNKEEALSRLGGNEAVLKEIYDIFLQKSPRKMELIKQAVNNNDMEEVVFNAHSFKGQCMTIGAEICRDLAESLEKASKRDEMERVRQLFEKLEYEVDKVIGRLKLNFKD